MTDDRSPRSALRAHRWRIAGWGVAAALLLLPLVGPAGGFAWGPEDFVAAALLLGGTGLAAELALARSRSPAYRAAVALALAGALLLVWMSLAVGLIGSEDNPANLLFAGVLAVAALGALLARLRPRGMARALLATAAAQALVVALVPAARQIEVLALTAGFVAIWLASAWLFRRAAEGPGAAAAP